MANEIAITPRSGALKGQRVRVVFPATPKNATTATRRGIQAIEVEGAGKADNVELDRPVLTAPTHAATRRLLDLRAAPTSAAG